jgi:hypothetical protein
MKNYKMFSAQALNVNPLLFLLSFISFVLILMPSSSHGFMEDGTVVRFDAQNSVTFESVGDFSVSIVLKITRDGQESEWPLNLDKYYVGGTIHSMTYANKDLLWIVSRLGHATTAATLLNIPMRCVEKTFSGSNYSFSGDKLLVAYFNRIKDQEGKELKKFLFIDDFMIFPRIEKFDFRGPFTIDREGANDIRKYDTGDEILMNDLKWSGNSLLFVTKATQDGAKVIKTNDLTISKNIEERIKPLSRQLDLSTTISLHPLKSIPQDVTNYGTVLEDIINTEEK